ncbi:flavoprotein, partial [Suillus ampliporus]
YKIGEQILHIDLRHWADIVLVAPYSVSTLSKIAQGLCDNLATSPSCTGTYDAPTYIFPAMNTLMYAYMSIHLRQHLRVIRDIVRYQVVGPIGKNPACGDAGM